MIAISTKFALAVGLMSLLHSANAGESGKAGRIPVLLELFTSEGCSSCPPADRLLQKLDRDQPVPEAELIVLSEHVDYWNRLGWTDPYSSSAFSRRQQDYSTGQGEEVYTPQLVIDGSKQVVGSNWADAERAIKNALAEKKIPVTLTAENSGNEVKVHLTVGARENPHQRGAIYLALAADHEPSMVLRGENAGHALSHVAVVYSIRKVASLSNDEVTRDLTVDAKIGSHSGGLRVIAIVEDSSTKHTLGVAEARIQN